MANYKVEFKKSALKDFTDIPKSDVTKIIERIDSLRLDPRPPTAIKLSGREEYRVRQGNYRILYEIRDSILVVLVIKVGHRREVYK